MRVVFMGTPEFSASILAELASQHHVVAVYTRPDARGRGQAVGGKPGEGRGRARGIPSCAACASLRDADEQAAWRRLSPTWCALPRYGMLLPAEVLAIPRFGCLNVHVCCCRAGAVPARRKRAILAGDEEAGVCIMRMEEGLDTGDYCVCRSIDVADKNAALLTDQLADLGAHALLTALSQLEAGCLRWTAQEETRVTYAYKIEKGELDLFPDDDVWLACAKVRASSDAHPAHAVVADKPVTVLSARPAVADEQSAKLSAGMVPGQVRFAGKRLFIGCTDGAVELLEIKPNGKQAMAAKAFAAGIQGIKDDTKIWEGPRG